MSTTNTQRVPFGANPPQIGNDGMQSVPGSLGPYAISDPQGYLVFQITLCATVDDSTVTVQDGNGKKIIANIPLAANQTFVINFPEGVRMINGIYWIRSTGTNVDGEIFGTAFRKQ